MRNRVLFISYYGEQYSGSPKYISRYLQEHTDIDLTWAFTEPEKHAEYTGRKIKYGSPAYYYHLATSKVIVTNYRMTEDFEKRKGQTYIQTWHSSLRLKMIENDAIDTLPPHYVEMARKDSKQIDYLLAGSEKSKEIFERSFWYDGTIMKSGTPQCDILLNQTDEYIRKVHKYYRIPDGAHIMLYAPTFRKNHNTSVYDLDFERINEELHARFGGEWYTLIRLHPHLLNQIGNMRYSDHILQATDYDDVQELLCAADVLISDYSAIMFDYSITKRPCFLYYPDLEEYTSKDRNLYFDIGALPFIGAHTQEELLQSIADFSPEGYTDSVDTFLKQIGSYDDGHAAERVAQLIEEVMK
ncbi:MAG: CDP-glycerol glycerophosphotransferase family protein [Solobacterium sp.]|nr:CDP-glycerol glycerophosphotransferase family protein [Solobacterium sp.]